MKTKVAVIESSFLADGGTTASTSDKSKLLSVPFDFVAVIAAITSVPGKRLRNYLIHPKGCLQLLAIRTKFGWCSAIVERGLTSLSHAELQNLSVILIAAIISL